jgi:hypothetical protein
MMTEEKFRAMCEGHDVTYEMSDDNRSYTRGRDQRQAIDLAAVQLPRARAVAIWNAAVDTKLVPEARAMFYWK